MSTLTIIFMIILISVNWGSLTLLLCKVMKSDDKSFDDSEDKVGTLKA